MNLQKMMSSWWKKFELYSFWDKESLDGGTIPLISFSLDAWVSEDRPMAYYATYDTNRWRYAFVSLCISRRQIRMYLPFKQLPDYVPTGKAMLRTRKIAAANKEKQQEFVDMINGIKKV